MRYARRIVMTIVLAIACVSVVRLKGIAASEAETARITSTTLKGVSVKAGRATLGNMGTVEIQDYENPVKDDANHEVIVGELIFHVDWDKAENSSASISKVYNYLTIKTPENVTGISDITVQFGSSYSLGFTVSNPPTYRPNLKIASFKYEGDDTTWYWSYRVKLVNSQESYFTSVTTSKVSASPGSFRVTSDDENKIIYLNISQYSSAVPDKSTPITITPNCMIGVYCVDSQEDGFLTRDTTGKKFTGSLLQAPMKFTLSKGNGDTVTYTVIANTLWGINYGPAVTRNYNVVSTSYGDTTELGTSTTTAVNTIPEGETVTVVVSPVNTEDAGKIIDSVKLVNTYTGEEIVSTIAANTFTFTMPANEVEVKSITFKEDDRTRYTLSSSVSNYLTTVNSPMGTVVFKDVNGVPIDSAAEGDTVNVSVLPAEETTFYDFVVEEWSSEQSIVPENEKNSSTFSFQMPDKAVKVSLKMRKSGTSLTLTANDLTAGTVSLQILETSTGPDSEYKDIVKVGSQIKIRLSNVAVSQELVGWSIFEGDVDITNDTNKVSWDNGTYKLPVVTIGNDPIVVKALFAARKYATVSVSSADSVMGSAGVNDSQSSNSTVFSGDTVTISATPSSDMYAFDHWEILSPDQTTADEADKITLTDISASGSTKAKATFTMIEKPVEIQAVFKKVKFSSEKLLLSAVILDKNDPAKTIGRVSSQGTNYTITLPDTLTPEEAATLVSGGSYLKLTASNLATIAQSGGYDEATGEKRWANGEVETKLSLNTPCTFIVKAEDRTTQDYTITIVYEERKSSEKEITEVVLLDKVTKDVIVSGTLEGTAWTVQLPQTLTTQEAGQLASGGAYLKVTASDKASVAQEGSYDDKGQVDSWGSGNVLCYMDLNKAVTFTVTAEDGSTQAYTITIAYTEPDPDQPVLTAGTVDRTSDSEAKITFTSDMAGKYYYRLAESGAVTPDMDISGDGLTAKKGTNTISLTTLSAGAKDLYIVVVSSNGKVSDVLKIEIPAYDEAETLYKISLSYPTAGGTITVSSTSAKAGETITVTVTPKTGKRLVPGSLKYSESTAGGAVVNIDETTLKFTMPASEISISCTWEDDTSDTPSTSEKAITTFMINGVTGTVNDTAGTISITLPNGTDLTSLSPVIGLGDDVKSISPASGKTVDLSKPVTYTVTMKDGTTKLYTVTAYTEAPPKSEQLWEQMLENIGGNTSSSGSGTWWEKAKKEKKKNEFPSYW